LILALVHHTYLLRCACKLFVFNFGNFAGNYLHQASTPLKITLNMANSKIPIVFTMPPEIWINIMSNTGDFKTITSLAKTCRGLNVVWKEHESQIIFDLLDSANRYQTNSYGYAACHLVENQLYFKGERFITRTRKHKDQDKCQRVLKLFAVQLERNALAKKKCAEIFRETIKGYPDIAEWETMVFSAAFYRFWLCALWVTHVPARARPPRANTNPPAAASHKAGISLNAARVLAGRDQEGNRPASFDSAKPGDDFDHNDLLEAYFAIISTRRFDKLSEAAHIADCHVCGFSFERSFTEQCWPGWPLRIRDTASLIRKSGGARQVALERHTLGAEQIQSSMNVKFEFFNYVWRQAHELPKNRAPSFVKFAEGYARLYHHGGTPSIAWVRRHLGWRESSPREYPEHDWFRDVNDGGPRGFVPEEDDYARPTIPLDHEFDLNLGVAAVALNKAVRSERVWYGSGRPYRVRSILLD
jgi:hypothetical protein